MCENSLLLSSMIRCLGREFRTNIINTLNVEYWRPPFSQPSSRSPFISWMYSFCYWSSATAMYSVEAINNKILPHSEEVVPFKLFLILYLVLWVNVLRTPLIFSVLVLEHPFQCYVYVICYCAQGNLLKFNFFKRTSRATVYAERVRDVREMSWQRKKKNNNCGRRLLCSVRSLDDG